MNRFVRTTIALLLTTLFLGALALGMMPPARAAPATAIRYVAPGGHCGGAAPCYASIQAAVDAAQDGDIIKVAAGTYTGAQTKVSATTGYTYTQVVMVDGKSLTLKGGFIPTDWNAYDPAHHPTIIDAQQHGRGISILGDGSQTVTVTGFQIVNGDYTNLGNPDGVGYAACPSTGGDCAGGLLAYRVKIFLQDTLIRNNNASRLRPYSHAGGALLWSISGGSHIDNTQIFSNTNLAWGYCGGLEVFYATGGIKITHSQFDQNYSTADGGGLKIDSVDGPIVIEDSRVVGNSAVGSYDAQGGGLRVLMSNDVLLNRVEFRDNQAAQDGAAINIEKGGSGGPTLRLVNVLVAGSQLSDAGTYGSAVNIQDGVRYQGFNIHLQHVTIADNQTPGAIRIAQYDNTSTALTASFTNTLIADATYGVVGAHFTSTLTINQTNSLFFDVTNPTVAEAGAPTFNTTGTVSGNPKLNANQRLQAGSAAIDAGVNSGVHLDLDGGVRPGGAGYDIGADEYKATAPGSLRFSQATYAVAEGARIRITVERVGGSAGSVSVRYATSDGTATAGNDYTAASGVLSFVAGEAGKSFFVDATRDGRNEADETFVLALSAPTGGATLGDPGQAVVTIMDMRNVYLPLAMRRH